MNGYYAKVVQWSESTQRFGVNFRGRVVALKQDNLSMGMRAEEMSSSDEDLLLNLELTRPDVQALPWTERMQRLGLLSGQGNRRGHAHRRARSELRCCLKHIAALWLQLRPVRHVSLICLRSQRGVIHVHSLAATSRSILALRFDAFCGCLVAIFFLYCRGTLELLCRTPDHALA